MPSEARTTRATAAEIMALFHLLGAIAAAIIDHEAIAPDGNMVGKAIDIASDCKPAIRFATRSTVPRQRYRIYGAIKNFQQSIREKGSG